jgi:hypothetical protein
MFRYYQKLYTNIIAGKKPDEIIAAHGFHPAVVETEYRRSQNLRRDMLTKRIMSEVLIMKTSKKGDAIVDKYHEQGDISDDDLIELLTEYTLTMQQMGASSARAAMGFPGWPYHRPAM